MPQIKYCMMDKRTLPSATIVKVPVYVRFYRKNNSNPQVLPRHQCSIGVEVLDIYLSSSAIHLFTLSR